MSGLLAESVAMVVRQALVNLGLATDPPSSNWPAYGTNEPDSPDNVITVYDTVGREDGRMMVGGERNEQHGFQIRIRSTTHKVGYAKARAIAVGLDTASYPLTVRFNSGSYLVYDMSRTGDVNALSKDVPTTKRSLFTINGVIAVRQIA